MEKRLSPEVAASLANAVSHYFSGRYPADNQFPVSRTSESIILLESRAGKLLQSHVPKSVLTESLQELRVNGGKSYDWLTLGAQKKLKKHYAWKFYRGLEALWFILERKL